MQKHISKYLEKSEGILSWFVVFLLIFIPLYFKFPLIFVEGTFVSIRLEDVLIILVLGFWIFHIILSGEYKSLIKKGFMACIFSVFLIGMISVFSSVFLTKTTSFHLAFLHLARRMELILLFPLSFYVSQKLSSIKPVLAAYFGVVLLISTYGFGQKYLKFPAVSTNNSELSKGIVFMLGEGDRISSTFAGHYDLASYLLIAEVITVSVLFYLLQKKPSKNKLVIVFLSVIACLSMITLIVTAARLTFIAVFFCLALLFVLLKKYKFIFLTFVTAIALLVYPSNLRDRFISTFRVNIQKTWSTFSPKSKDQVQRSKLNIPTLPTSKYELSQSLTEAADIAPGEPTDTTDLGVYRSFDIRIKVEWPRALRAFLKNPFLGSGYSSLGLAVDNDYLRLLGEVGILGFLAFALLIYSIMRESFSLYKKSAGLDKYLSAAYIAILIGMLINAIFIDVFEASKVVSIFWIFTGLILGRKYAKQ